MRSGTPPSHPDRFCSAWHVHSAFSPGTGCARPMSGYGKLGTKWCIRWAAPRYVTPASPKSAWARMPHQVHERVRRVAGLLAADARHGPRHRRQRHIGAVLVAKPLPHPGRGMPLLAPAGAVLGEPLLDEGHPLVHDRRAPLAHGRLLGQVLLAQVLAHGGLAHARLAGYRRHRLAVPAETADRLYLGHAGHLPFRPFMMEIRSTIKSGSAGGRHASCLNSKNLRD